MPQETDFREADSKDYYGLAPGKAVMLRYAYPITCTGFTKDPATGLVTEVQVGSNPARPPSCRRGCPAPPLSPCPCKAASLTLPTFLPYGWVGSNGLGSIAHAPLARSWLPRCHVKA